MWILLLDDLFTYLNNWFFYSTLEITHTTVKHWNYNTKVHLIQYGYTYVILQCWLLNRFVREALKIQAAGSACWKEENSGEKYIKKYENVPASMWWPKFCFKCNSTFNHSNYQSVSGPQNLRDMGGSFRWQSSWRRENQRKEVLTSLLCGEFLLLHFLSTSSSWNTLLYSSYSLLSVKQKEEKVYGEEQRKKERDKRWEKMGL